MKEHGEIHPSYKLFHSMMDLCKGGRNKKKGISVYLCPCSCMLLVLPFFFIFAHLFMREPKRQIQTEDEKKIRGLLIFDF